MRVTDENATISLNQNKLNMSSLATLRNCFILLANLVGFIAGSFDLAIAQPPLASCQNKNSLLTIGDTVIWQQIGKPTIFYQSGMTIDADGSPHAYHPQNIGLDDLKHSKNQGCWVGILTLNGQPIVQGKKDPAPGFYVSTTTLFGRTKKNTDPLRFVNAEQIPYIVLPREKTSAKIGDFAVVYNSKNGRITNTIYADDGPQHLLDEGSIALAKALGIDSNPKTGGINTGTMYVVFLNSGAGQGQLRLIEDINKEVQKHFKAWGGMN